MSDPTAGPSGPSSLDKSAYTVGWITALAHEAAASFAMLDRVHPALEEHERPRDDNIYSLGSIQGPAGGEHHVVITSLPEGRYGNVSAATVAAHMLASFPAIKFGLMVGIGGGIWSRENDVRLGDIVVSRPEGELGGVRLYDNGKETTHGFERYGQLNSPPTALLHALSRLKQDHEMNGSKKVPEYLKQMQESFPKMKQPKSGPGYVHQGKENDRLFLSEYIHQGTSSDCDACDRDQLVKRAERNDQDPEIHYGIIGSGNKVIKDAKIRDSIAQGCLCFETEAAGLMNNFPCLVIRGISDYCDSHKNDQWQKYAAATAAAYAKELLGVMPPARVAEMQAASKEMAKVQQTLDTALEKVTTVEEKQRADGLRMIVDSMSQVEYGHRLDNILDLKCKDTGLWLLELQQVQAWLSSLGRALICRGDPGVGKTFLSATVIESILERHEDDPKVGIAFLFCDFGREEEQKIEQLLSSLLQQLCRTPRDLPEPIVKMYTQHRRGVTRPRLEEISKSLRLIVEMFSKVFIVVDALDECKSDRRDAFISELLALNKMRNVNLLVTTRDVYTPLQQLDSVAEISIQAATVDIIRYIKAQKFNIDEVNDALQSEIEKVICSKSNGMFLLAKLLVKRLVQCTSLGDLRDTLEEIKSGQAGENLKEAYQKTVDQITRDPTRDLSMLTLAKKTLAWLVLTNRQPSVLELRSLLAIKSGSTNFDGGRRPPISTILTACEGLVTTDKALRTVRLIHFTTKEFFANPEQDFLRGMHAYLAETCLTYLSYNRLPNGRLEGYDEAEPALYAYAASHWNHHLSLTSAEQLAGESPLTEVRDRFLQTEPSLPAYQLWLSRLAGAILASIVRSDSAEWLDLIFSPRNWARQGGYELFEKPHAPRKRHYYFVLRCVVHKSLQWSRMVLAPRTQPEYWKDLETAAKEDMDQAALSDGKAASAAGLAWFKDAISSLTQYIRWHKQKQGGSWLRGSRFPRPWLASDEVEEEYAWLRGTVQSLQDLLFFLKPEMRSSKRCWRRTLPSALSEDEWDNLKFSVPKPPGGGKAGDFGFGFREELANLTIFVLETLTEGKTELLSLSKPQQKAQSPWDLSMNMLNQDVVRKNQDNRYIYLDLDELVQWIDGFFSGIEVVVLLVRCGANPNTELPRSWVSSCPLICAINDDSGTEKHVRHLLDHGANINQLARHGASGTGLIAACAKGRDDILSLLLGQPGIDVNQVAVLGEYGTALIAACVKGRDDILLLLLGQTSININQVAAVGKYRTALIAACSDADRKSSTEERAKRVQLLLSRGASVAQQAPDGRYTTALVAACTHGFYALAKMLLDESPKTPTEASRTVYETALNAAIHSRSPRTVALLSIWLQEANGEPTMSRLSTLSAPSIAEQRAWDCFGTRVHVTDQGSEALEQCRLAARQVAAVVISSLVGIGLSWQSDFMCSALRCLRLNCNQHDRDFRGACPLLEELEYSDAKEAEGYLYHLRSMLRTGSMGDLEGVTLQKTVDNLAQCLPMFEEGIILSIASGEVRDNLTHLDPVDLTECGFD